MYSFDRSVGTTDIEEEFQALGFTGEELTRRAEWSVCGTAKLEAHLHPYRPDFLLRGVPDSRRLRWGVYTIAPRGLVFLALLDDSLASVECGAMLLIVGIRSSLLRICTGGY